MKLGVTMSTLSNESGPIVFRGTSVAEHLPIIKELGFDGVDLFAGWKSDEEIDALKETFAAAAIEIAMFVAIFLAQQGVNLSCKDADQRREYVNAYKEQIRKGSRLGTTRMPVGYLRGARTADDTPDAYFARLAQSLDELQEFGDRHGVTLCLEPINRYEINTLNNVEECLAFLDEYEQDGVGLLLDTFHMNIEDASLEQAIRKAGKKVKHVHAPDSNRYAAGSGHLDFSSILRALQEIDYDGYLALEAFPEPDPVTCATDSAHFLRSKLAELQTTQSKELEKDDTF